MTSPTHPNQRPSVEIVWVPLSKARELLTGLDLPAEDLTYLPFATPRYPGRPAAEVRLDTLALVGGILEAGDSQPVMGAAGTDHYRPILELVARQIGREPEMAIALAVNKVGGTCGPGVMANQLRNGIRFLAPEVEWLKADLISTLWTLACECEQTGLGINGQSAEETIHDALAEIRTQVLALDFGKVNPKIATFNAAMGVVALLENPEDQEAVARFRADVVTRHIDSTVLLAQLDEMILRGSGRPLNGLNLGIERPQ